MSKSISRQLPWFASINWDDGVAHVGMESPSNVCGVRVAVASAEDALELSSIVRRGGGTFHGFYVTAFIK